MADHGFDLTARVRDSEVHDLRREITPAERVAAKRRIAADPGSEPPVLDGDELLIFAVNNRLGLANHERVQAAAAEAAKDVGTGAGVSRLVTGDTAVHRAIERALARC